jgi:hypothetical protein
MLENEDGSNLRWLVAAALIALGMGLVSVQFKDTKTAASRMAASLGSAAQVNTHAQSTR